MLTATKRLRVIYSSVFVFAMLIGSPFESLFQGKSVKNSQIVQFTEQSRFGGLFRKKCSGKFSDPKLFGILLEPYS